MKTALYYLITKEIESLITGNAKITGVIGYPIGHSLSPRLHNYWLQSNNIDGVYIPLKIEANDLQKVIRLLPSLGFVGANITIPYKEEVFKLVDAKTERADKIGAVNTIFIDKDSSIIGDNTDGFGFISNLESSISIGSKITGAATVIGAGGAAKSIISSLYSASISEIRLVNRTRQKADDLAQAFGGKIQVYDWKERHNILDNTALLINTTSLGMEGKPELNIDLKKLPIHAVVTDVVYSPLLTPLLKAAQQRGNDVVDGLGMLIYQAIPGFQAWYGVKPDVTKDLRAHLLAK